MAQQYRYTIILHPEPEEGGYSVNIPALPGCHTQGDTLEEAIANAREAIQCYVEGLKLDGLPVPEEREHPQAITISVAAKLQSAVSAPRLDLLSRVPSRKSEV